jgi:hypothetical protein
MSADDKLTDCFWSGFAKGAGQLIGLLFAGGMFLFGINAVTDPAPKITAPACEVQSNG